MIEVRWRPFVLAAAAALLATTAFAAILQFQMGSQAVVIAIDDLGEAVAALFAAAACAWAARDSAGRLRVGWALMAASAAAWCIGEAIWSVYEVGLGQELPFPSAADAGFLAAVPFAFAGVLSFWTAPRGTSTRWHVWLDGLIIAIALTFAGYAFGLGAVFESSGSSLQEKVIGVAYPAGDILIATVLILAIRRAPSQQQGRVLLLLGGLAANSFADSAFTYLTAADQYGAVGSVIDTGWVAGYLMIALAALWPATKISSAAERAPIDLWQLALPWVAVMAAGAGAIVSGLKGEPLDTFLSVLAGALAVLLMVRQVIAHRESLTLLISTRRSEQTLSDVIASAPIGIARAGTDFKVVSANPRLAALFHESPAGMVGSTIAKYLPPEVQPEVFEKLGGLLRGETDTVEAETPMVRPDGGYLWVHWTSTAVRKATGQIDYFLTMLEDTTARHEAEEATKGSLATLERLNQLKTDFMQSVSHEFKTSLIGIQGFSEYMRDAEHLDVEEVRTFAGDIFKDAHRLDRMVTEMLSLDRAETESASIRVGRVDLHVIIRREVESARHGAGGVNLAMDLAHSLATVSGASERLAELMRTLLHNAIRYSPDGGKVLVTSHVDDEEVEVTVQDQGVGMRADFDNRLFGQDDLYANNPIRKVVGTGLGLGIARQIVELHGGHIWVERLEAGSSFHFTIPVAGRPANAQGQAGRTIAGKVG